MMSDVAWYSDPGDVERHPWRASALVFGALFVFWSVLAYFALTSRSVVTALLFGAGFGAAGLLGMWRGLLHRRRRRVGQPPTVVGGRFGVDVLAMGAGVGIAVFGVTSGDAGVVGSGGLLFALGLAWYLIKRTVARR
jgi:drug/metabolite transporter (DMT)-like permease